MASSALGKQIFWTVGTSVPPEFPAISNLSTTLLPRTVAWCCAANEANEKVALLDGYTAASYTPPYLFFAASCLPREMIEMMIRTKTCTLSAATMREPESAFRCATQSPNGLSFEELGLVASKELEDYPSVVASSPIRMFCTLDRVVDLCEGEQMVVLIAETFMVSGEVQSPPTDEMKKGRKEVSGKIDAALVNPIVGVGNGKFVPLAGIRSMPRPKKTEIGSWTSTNLEPAQPTIESSDVYPTLEWSFRKHGQQCALGFNPVTALVMPRPIGWISTYNKVDQEEAVLHVAPYSFFIDVARGDKPMVGFSGYRSDDGKRRKDAQRDAEESGCFVFNLVSENFAVPMNYSAAELGRIESEFELAGLKSEPASLVDAPTISGALVKFECKYVRTENVGSFSIVIGEVVAVSVDSSILLEGAVDVTRLRPLSRMGYMDEYGLVVD